MQEGSVYFPEPTVYWDELQLEHTQSYIQTLFVDETHRVLYGAITAYNKQSYYAHKGQEMLGYIMEKTTALVSETVDVVTDVGNYIYEDIASIPEAVEKGWDNGLFTSTEEDATEQSTKPSNDIL